MNSHSRGGGMELVINRIAKRLSSLENTKETITPRDFFAGLAMCGMLAYGDTLDRSPKYLADKSEKIADAMMENRK